MHKGLRSRPDMIGTYAEEGFPMADSTPEGEKIAALIQQLPTKKNESAPFQTVPAHSSRLAFARSQDSLTAERTLQDIFTAPNVRFRYGALNKLDDLIEIAERSPPLFPPVLMAFANVVDNLGKLPLSRPEIIIAAGQIGRHMLRVAAAAPGAESVIDGAGPAGKEQILSPGQTEAVHATQPQIASIRAHVARSMLDLADKSNFSGDRFGVELGWIADGVRFAPSGSIERQRGLELLDDPRADVKTKQFYARKFAEVSEGDEDYDHDLARWAYKTLETSSAGTGEYPPSTRGSGPISEPNTRPTAVGCAADECRYGSSLHERCYG